MSIVLYKDYNYMYQSIKHHLPSCFKLNHDIYCLISVIYLKLFTPIQINKNTALDWVGQPQEVCFRTNNGISSSFGFYIPLNITLSFVQASPEANRKGDS